VGRAYPVLDFPRQLTPGPHDCAWCGGDVQPVPVVNARGEQVGELIDVYPLDEDGDVSCVECLVLPPYYVTPGHA
jgi:hypothetical protein